MYNLWNRIKSGISDIVKSRTFIAIIMFCVLSAVLLQRVFYLQIVKGQNYTDKYELQIQKTKEVEGTRGNIYDRNGKLLAYNELAYAVTVQDTGDYPKSAGMNGMLLKLVQILNKHGYQAQGKLEIALNEDGEMVYTSSSEAARKRFLRDFYGRRSVDELDDE